MRRPPRPGRAATSRRFGKAFRPRSDPMVARRRQMVVCTVPEDPDGTVGVGQTGDETGDDVGTAYTNYSHEVGQVVDVDVVDGVLRLVAAGSAGPAAATGGVTLAQLNAAIATHNDPLNRHGLTNADTTEAQAAAAGPAAAAAQSTANAAGVAAASAASAAATAQTAANTVSAALARLKGVETVWGVLNWTEWGTEMVMSQDIISTFTKSVIADGAARRGRLSNDTGSGGGGTRILLLRDGTEAVDSEVTGVFYSTDPPTVGGRQTGLCLRAQVGGNGRPIAYVVWHDTVFAQDQILNIGVWSTNGATPPAQVTLASVNFTFDSLIYRWPILSSSRTGTTVTLVVSSGHRVAVGDGITVTGLNAALNGNWFVTATTLTTVTYSTVNSGAIAVGGAGQLADFHRIMPYYVKARLIAQRVMVKAWPCKSPFGGEPAWGDPAACALWDDTGNVGPTTAGKSGYMAGHLLTGKKLDLGPFRSISLD